MKIILPLLLLFFSSFLTAQCYVPQTLDFRLGECGLVVTGSITNSEPFYNEQGQIDTRHTLQVHETWFGDNNLSSLNVITRGGRINEELTVVRPSLYLQTGDMGVFLLRQSSEAVDPDDWHTVAVHESMIAIDTLLGVGYDQDYTYTNLDELYEKLSDYYNRAPYIRRPVVRHREIRDEGAGRSMMPSISNFNPTSLSAGTGAVLTINGSGFGSTQGVVFFDSPDDGIGGSFISVPDEAILSWNNNQIRVEVTGQAGTGRIQVRTAGSSPQTAQSGQNLNVVYAVTSLNLGNGNFQNPRLIDDEANGDGGYTYLLSNNTANSGQSFAGNAAARAALQRALDTWQLDADYGIYAGIDCGVTSVQEPIQGDDVNVISFDNDAYDLDVRAGTGTVGIAFSYYRSCGSSRFEMTGNDIIFRRNGNPNGFGGSVNWYYGTGTEANNQTKFESVALHEIGHTHQLNHVSDPAQIMNFRVTSGQSITDLSADDLAAAAYMSNLAMSYNPPIVGCSGDFTQQRRYTGYDPAADCGESTLPVQYLSFTGRAENGVNKLQWATAEEVNNDYFNVERSADGRTFVPIGQVRGNGSSAARNDYDFDDFSPANGRNYYRLAQVDFDGAVHYSEVILLDFEVARPGMLSIAPNPFSERITLGNLPAGTTEITLMNTAGRLVLRQAIAAGTTNARLDTSTLPSGIYLVRAGDTVQRLVKR